ncbi:MAG TPA: hypothetical protein VH724_11595 [Candidatus Angelobacter sp.]|nr:hypothetical protein [Candidatus Angelobacter sp.]
MNWTIADSREVVGAGRHKSTTASYFIPAPFIRQLTHRVTTYFSTVASSW